MSHWIDQAVFYHIYPLGFCDALRRNTFAAQPEPRLEKIAGWLDHIQALGANALYLGPLFESSYHGYDTVDYFHVDRRLGSDHTLGILSADLHRRGMHLVLDGVFNHVGRDFWAFRDLRANRQASIYRDWFCGLDFSHRSPAGDPFGYEGWNGCYDLVKLNLSNPAVKDHLFRAVEVWVRDFGLDGLRLDAADCLDFGFMCDLAVFCRRLKPDFWLMGEVVHGDYRRWANPEMLDSVTNYEVYKGLYSSHADRNYHEIAYALNRQSGSHGTYREVRLYNFADNHDVNRVASNLVNPAHLYPLYCQLFTIPGIPSIYYGSEWGITGKRDRSSDRALRPALDLEQAARRAPQPDLAKAISRLAAIRRESRPLQSGAYEELYLSQEQLVFRRELDGEQVIVAVNAADHPAHIQIIAPAAKGARLVDLLNPGETFSVHSNDLKLVLHPNWARIMRCENG
jgi:cyclomaltodextrinase / maltogenic alpha-amylase / neopullulanase